jgi:hypothetical protein
MKLGPVVTFLALSLGVSVAEKQRQAPVYERGTVTEITTRGEHRDCAGCSPLALAIARPGWRPYYAISTAHAQYVVMGKPSLEIRDTVLLRIKGNHALIVVERLGDGMQEHPYRLITAAVKEP